MYEYATILCHTQNDTIYVLRRLGQCGIRGSVVRPPRDNMIRSCSWGVRISTADMERAERCMKRLPSIRWKWLE